MIKKTFSIFVLLCFGIGIIKAQNSQTISFAYTGTIQNWTVPGGVTQITLTAAGGGGGGITDDIDGNTLGIKGASLTGICDVTPGNVLSIVVGGAGVTVNIVCEQFKGTGGGGGSFIYDSNTNSLLEAVGGGGGLSMFSTPGGPGGTDIITNATTNGGGRNAGGGSGGNGGLAGVFNSNGGAGGAGLLSNGDSLVGMYGCTGGKDRRNLFKCGIGYYGNNGGYGGGGAGGLYGGGGGGGYNGGGGGLGDTSLGGGGGGSSYLNGTLVGIPVANNLGNGYVTITYATASVIVTVDHNVSCNGGDNGSASCNVTGGNSPYTYSWSDANSQTTATATGLSAGTYTVIIIDNIHDTLSALAIITQPAVLSVSANTILNVSCNGGSNGSAFSVASGGGAPYTYSWSGGGGTNATATGLNAASYTVTVSDSCGNSATASVTITQPNTLSISASIVGNVSCNGGNSGSATSIVNGGSSPYTYLWSDGNSQTTVSATGLTTGTYTVTVSDFCGSTMTASVTITQAPVLSVTIFAVVDVHCYGDNNGSETAAATGGTGAYTYSWAPSGGTSITATGLTGGFYTVTVTDANGCSATASSACVLPPLPLNVSINAIVDLKCNGGNSGSMIATASGGTPAYGYIWAPSGSGTTISNLTAGCYTVTVADANGCLATASACITEPPPIVVNITPGEVPCYGGNNGSAISSVSAGTAPYTYSWSNGPNSPNISALGAGTYTLNVTDNNGCTGSASVSITQPAAITIIADSVNDNGGCNGSAWAIVNGGTLSYSYLWTSGGTTDSIKNQCAGNYCCVVTDANGCVDSACVSINIFLGIGNTESNTGVVTIYPNPNNGMFQLGIRN